jgi:MFS transporter, DHA2 family, multidrug resistance protein
VLRHRGFAISAFALFFAFGAFVASLILLPLWLQLGMGYTATTAGYVLAQQGMLGVLAAPLAAYLMKRIDPRYLMSGALLVLAGAILWRSNFATMIGPDQMQLPQLAIGVALPFFFVPVMTTSLQFVPQSETSSASAIINFLRTLAGGIATAVVVFKWNRETVSNHAMLTEFQTQSGQYFSHLASRGFSRSAALQMLDTLTLQQGMVLAVDNVFADLGLILLLSAAGIWLIPKLALATRPASQ